MATGTKGLHRKERGGGGGGGGGGDFKCCVDDGCGSRSWVNAVGGRRNERAQLSLGEHAIQTTHQQSTPNSRGSSISLIACGANLEATTAFELPVMKTGSGMYLAFIRTVQDYQPHSCGLSAIRIETRSFLLAVAKMSPEVLAAFSARIPPKVVQ
ncbi:uncharacterized protein LAESUDRAFT_717780 [Laetiporus sulphureus 93-53]|uniref:Uncharacterized protein n=1 Tax=Laetiporus sulphureus 93-53 TaxID=1314785 RepID=A0A165BG01_9APHY|nr:uncharacterized protein LAESUDRAFT_717780 [Laetiporus sulphureus 93-53]KZT00978.1 hypothetical protein LAESUDRAFT_717780 [Laetiporus sulphureus 93-53]